MTYAQQHIAETMEIASKIDVGAIEKMADLLAQVKAEDGRIFFLGVGGSAGNCGHAVNDFRKIVGIEAYAPTDNVSELTARTNDEGWATIFVEWLKVSKLQAEGRSVHLLGRRRQSGEEHQPQSRRGDQICEERRREGHGRRRARWRLYGAGGGRLLHHSDGEL